MGGRKRKTQFPSLWGVDRKHQGRRGQGVSASCVVCRHRIGRSAYVTRSFRKRPQNSLISYRRRTCLFRDRLPRKDAYLLSHAKRVSFLNLTLTATGRSGGKAREGVPFTGGGNNSIILARRKTIFKPNGLYETLAKDSRRAKKNSPGRHPAGTA